MAYFPDLSPYQYGGCHLDILHVGWLDSSHSFSKGKVEKSLVEKLKVLREKPVQITRGFHVCEFCPQPLTMALSSPECRSNGEIRVSSTMLYQAKDLHPNPRSTATPIDFSSGLVSVKKITFAAPVLITHYIETHDYLPPTEFLNAVEMHRLE